MRSAPRQDLLYVSDPAAEDVYVYTYPQLKSVATMTGFLQPYGLCSDAKGNVFIPSESNSGGSSTIYEYAHGGSSPIAKLSDPGIASGCAVDPRTGNLAVANRNDDANPDDAGDVAVYPHGSGSPTIYYSSDFSNFLFCGYDNRSGLFLSALSVNGEAVLAALPDGGTSLEQLSLNAPLYSEVGLFYPSVQWDGSHMTVSSLDEAKAPNRGPTKVLIYRLRFSGSNAIVIGTTTLRAAFDRNPHVGQVWFHSSTLVVPYTCCKTQQRVGLWPFPQGGPTRRSIEVAAGESEKPWGLTVSAGSK